MKGITQTLLTFDTKLTADCVEFCHPYLLCSTYQLNTNTKTREGIIHFFKIEKSVDSKNPKIQCKHLKELEISKIRGVFDVKFCFDKAKYIFALALSSGITKFYQIVHKKDSTCVELLCEFKYFEQRNMCLSMDWEKSKSDSCFLSTSHSNGNISISQFDFSRSKLTNQKNIKAHDFEVWNVEFDYFNKNVLYSGGDDSLFKCWDIKSNKRIFTCKDHKSGVCCIKSHPTKKHIVGTGSYDDYIRVYDVRKIDMPVILKKFHTNNGVWKIRWNKKREDILLAACMKNGFQIFNVNMFEGKETFEEGRLCTYHVTDDLSYGIDWVYTGDKNDLYVGSCSFYDHQFQFWKLNEKK